MSAPPLLAVEDLKTQFYAGGGIVPAVDGVSFNLGRGETLGIVGESGCGKSVTSLSILRLIPEAAGRIAGGRILFEGRDLLSLSAEEMRRVRGNQISMIFQEPMTSLNPIFSIGAQIGEAIGLHQGAGKREIAERTVEL